ncbi:MAG: hypothetical protein ACRD4P_03895 [Bryobacteraceae bacterium]
MDGVNHQFFAGTRFAANEDRGIRDRHLADQLVDLLHCRAVANNNDAAWTAAFRRRIVIWRRAFQFPRQIALLHRTFQSWQQVFEIEGLGHVIECA